eukprot:5387094-Pyramimonas_sp.AAC.1
MPLTGQRFLPDEKNAAEFPRRPLWDDVLERGPPRALGRAWPSAKFPRHYCRRWPMPWPPFSVQGPRQPQPPSAVEVASSANLHR